MTRQEFFTLLQKHRISAELVSFSPEFRDGYCVRKNRLRWEVFVRERGIEYDILGFPSESNALQYLLDELIRIYGKPC